PGREAAGADAGGDRPDHPADGGDDDLRHARPDRGDDPRPPGRGDEEGGTATGRRTAGAVRPAGEPVRRRLHRLPRDEPHAGRVHRGHQGTGPRRRYRPGRGGHRPGRNRRGRSLQSPLAGAGGRAGTGRGRRQPAARVRPGYRSRDLVTPIRTERSTMRRTQLGLVVAAVLAAASAGCGGASALPAASSSGGGLPDLTGQKLEVIGIWSAAEQDAFQAVLKKFADATHAQVTYTSGGNDVNVLINSRL